MASKTISITIPEQLEDALKKQATSLGLSRSRYICNILLEWQKETNIVINNCNNLNEGWCNEFGIYCKAPQSEAETCACYKKDK